MMSLHVPEIPCVASGEHGPVSIASIYLLHLDEPTADFRPSRFSG